MAHTSSHPPFVTTSGAISYVGQGFNPFTGKKNDFSKVRGQIPSNSTTRANATLADADPEEFAIATSGVNPNQFWIDLAKASAGSGSGSGSMTAAQAAQLKLDRDKFNYGKTQDDYTQNYQNQVFDYGKSQDAAAQAAALEALQFGRNKDARVLGGMENYYTSGQYGKGFDKLLNMITAQGKVSGDAVTDAYGRATTNINQGYDAAQGLGDSGYNALNTYLQANPNNPYAGMQAGVGSAPDALTQYLNAYGVSDQPVQGQIQADQLQAQQGAGNYQNLIDILSGVAQSGASSRGAESAMGQNLFNTGLGQERAGYQGAATNAQQQALNALQQQMFQSRFGVENDRTNVANQLAMAIVQAGGTVTDGTTTTDPTTTTTDPTKTVNDATDNQDDSEVSRTFEGTGAGRIRITKWTSGKTTREPDPDKNYKAPVDDIRTMDIKQGQVATEASPQEILANQLNNLQAPAQAQGLTAQQLLDQLNERRGYVPQQPVMNPQIQALLQSIAAQQVAGNSSGGGRGNLMDMF